MDDLCTYQIEIWGQMDEKDLNASSPLHANVVRVEPDSTLAVVYTDQAGVIGLLRHLHGRGFVFLSVVREP